MADGSAEEKVLYDLNVHVEWPVESDNVVKQTPDRPHASLTSRTVSVAQRYIWTFLRTVGFQQKSSSPCSLPVGLVKLVNSQLSWLLAVSSDGQLLAIVQDTAIEIRSACDGFDAVLGRCAITRDPCPQWRAVAWNPESTMLVYSNSTGSVEGFDIMGTSLFTIPSTTMLNPKMPVDLSRAVCSLVFVKYQATNKWLNQLLVINYQGSLHCYLLSDDSEYKLEHTFLFGSQYPRGVNYVVYESQHSILLVGGACDIDNGETTTLSAKYGLSSWRILSGHPYYKMVTDYDQDVSLVQKRGSILRRLRSAHFYNWNLDKQDSVFKMNLSPDSTSLVVIYHSGLISVWQVPSLHKHHIWKLQEQPNYGDINPIIAENPRVRKFSKEYNQNPVCVDINWWTHNILVLARCTGSVTLSSMNTLKNLLGDSPEWFEPTPRVTPAYDGGFLGLECEVRYTLKRHLAEDRDDNEYEDSDDEMDASLVSKSTRVVKHMLYWMTDSERFQPPKKRPKFVSKTYRLVCLKSTTPEELYAKKIDNEEYGEALELAKAYGLDCDLVYQRQWRKSPVSVASIQDYLSKISKRSWVLQECLERIPDSIDAMKELLQYGLRGTDLEALIVIGKNEDQGRFILCDEELLESLEESYDEFNPAEIEAREQVKKAHRQRLLEQVDFSQLTLKQKDLCRAREKLLQYRYRLDTYQEILGGQHVAEELFDPKFFETFRSQNIVELATDYARGSDWNALDILFCYHSDDCQQHRLAILANFPETDSPAEYANLLPGISAKGDVVAKETYRWYDEDWVESSECRSAILQSPCDLGAFLYEENKNYAQFRATELDGNTVTQWYIYRACEIEHLSHQVDNSLSFIHLAIDRNVQGLDRLHDDFITMDVLAYECQVDDSVTFDVFRSMEDIDKLQLLMSKSSLEMYVKHLHLWLVPFLARCEKYRTGVAKQLLRKYMVSMAADDLTYCLKIFESSMEKSKAIIEMDEEMLSLALDCVYTCERSDQLHLATQILECLPQRPEEIAISKQEIKLHNEVDDLEKHILVTQILHKNAVECCVSFIKQTQADSEAAMDLFTKMTRIAGRREPALNVLQWKSLLDDLLNIQSKVYKCVSQQICYEIYTKSLLCSSRLENIKLAGEYIERSQDEHKSSRGMHDSDWTKHKKVYYDSSVQLVLSAAREYFDSSADLMDSCMDLARACLRLITDDPPVIQEELDLIAALGLVDDFGVAILPLQVRLCDDRLKLIQKAIDSKSNNYKNQSKLMRLGSLLHVEAENAAERNGKILKLVTVAALKDNNYKVAYTTIDDLIGSCYADIWPECKALAEREEFSNLEAKVKLLSFAVTYCTVDMIEPIIRARSLLETKILYDEINSLTRETHPSEEITRQMSPRTGFTAMGALRQTREILTSTTKTTKNVLSTVSDTHWWKNTLERLDPLRSHDTEAKAKDDGNSHMTKQGCHPFYETIIPDCYSNQPSIAKETLDIALQLSDNLLRTAKLEETLTEGDTTKPCTEVLLQLAECMIKKDTPLGLAYLLALPQITDADKCFNHLPRTAISLQLAAYYYALHIHNSQQQYKGEKDFFQLPPAEVIMSAKSQMTGNHGNQLHDKLRHYNSLLGDYNQAQTLQALGKGVDIARFTQDNEYKTETILGLAMTLDEHVYGISLSLAKCHNIPLWEVYMNHLEFLFTDSGLSTADIEARVKKEDILDALRSNSSFPSRMKTYVYPSIEGRDHSRLLYYYTLLTGCESQKTMAPGEHVKLLKKIKPAAPGLDYKKLMDIEYDPIDVIKPILNSGNVHVIAKLVNKIPKQEGKALTQSTVFAMWATKMFWEGGPAKKMPETLDLATEWIHHYESCSDFIQKLLPVDFLLFIHSTMFVEDSIEQLGVECRSELVKRALKFSRQSAGKKKKTEDEGSMKWEDASIDLQQALNHIDLLKTENMIGLKQAEDGQLKEYYLKFDLSIGDTTKLQVLLVDMILDGQPPDLVQDVLGVTPVGKWTVQTAISEALRSLIQSWRENDDSFPRKDKMKILKSIVTQASEHYENGGDLVNPEIMIDMLRPFCSDVTIDVTLRLDVLHLLEKCFQLRDEDLSLLLLYRSKAIVELSWTDIEVLENDVCSDESRHKLFSRLLQEVTSLDQCLALSRLLKQWPPLKALSSSPSKHPWVKVLDKMLSYDCDNNQIIGEIKTIPPSQKLSEKCIEHLFSLLSGISMATASIVVFMSEYDQLYIKTVKLLVQEKQPEQDVELLGLICQRHLVPQFASSHYYPILIDYILTNQETESESCDYMDVKEISRQLKEAGYEIEAGSLLVNWQSVHPALRTFDAAVSYVSHFFRK